MLLRLPLSCCKLLGLHDILPSMSGSSTRSRRPWDLLRLPFATYWQGWRLKLPPKFNGSGNLSFHFQLTRGRSESSAFVQLQQLASIALKEEEEEQKPNPVTQRVKIIMSAGLVLVHAHSRLLASGETEYSDLALPDMNSDMSQYINPTTPLWKFYTYR